MNNLFKSLGFVCCLFAFAAQCDAQQTVTKVTSRCIICGGSGTCRVCFGSGGTYNSYTGLFYPCTYCFQTNRCRACGGSGSTTITCFINPDGSGYGVDQMGNMVALPSGARESASRGGRSSSSRSSGGTCSKCGGRGYESASYRYAAASASGWKQPYHNSGGSSCPYCNNSSDHYHYPCTSCYGYGHN